MTAPASAQNPVGADVDIFGDAVNEAKKPPDVIRPAASLLMTIFGKGSRAIAEPAKPKVEGMEHMLRFHNGRQMRGKLVELTKDEIVWSCLGVSEVLHFARSDVRRIVLNGTTDPGDSQQYSQQTATEKKPEPTSMATVKLAGSDWLHGEVSSADGLSFSIKTPGSALFTVTREKIGWFYYGKTAVTGFGMEMSNVDAWTISGGIVEDEKEGRLRFKTSSFVAKTMVPPRRFEVSFELPAGQKDAPAELWFQPYSPRPNNYSTGTIQLTFQDTEIERCIYENGFKRDKASIPADAPKADNGWNRFRIFYDGLDRKFTVLRNGAKVAEWALADEEQQANRGITRSPIRGLCFSRRDQQDLLIGKFRLQPWDGDMTTLDKKQDGDRLALPATPTESGKLTAIAGGKVTFSGAEKELMSGTMITLGEVAPSTTNGDALLVFGRSGEVSAADLVLRDGKATFRTNFAPQMEMEVTQLATVSFPSRGVVPSVSDILVFKNGDELPGKLIATTNGASLRWKTSAGPEVSIQPERVAGVRFAVKPIVKAKPQPLPSSAETPRKTVEDPAPEAPRPPTLELKNGDRLPGELVSMNAEAAHFKNTLLGERDIARSALWNYFTGPVIDGASGWLDSEMMNGRSVTPDRWITLDGSYFTRQTGDNSGEYAYLGRTGLKLPVRYELRCEALAIGEHEPYFSIMLAAKNGNSQLNFSFSNNGVNIHGYSQRGNARSFSTEVSTQNKFANPKRRLIRIFVDSDKGSTLLMCEGQILKKLGSRKEEAVPGLGSTVSFYSYGGYSATRLSNIWLGPWSGDLPTQDFAASVALSNGDTSPGEIRTVAEGKATVSTEVGEFELPLERITTVEFGGAPSTEKSAARLRLQDGATIHLTEFHWESDTLSAKSPALGDLKLAAADVAELILAPTVLRLPVAPPVKPATEASKADEAAPAVELVPQPK